MFCFSELKCGLLFSFLWSRHLTDIPRYPPILNVRIYRFIGSNALEADLNLQRLRKLLYSYNLSRVIIGP